MSPTPRRRLERRPFAVPIHPLLAAAYPIVFLFAVNVADQISVEPLWMPLALAVTAAAVLFAALSAVTREPHRAALLTTLLVSLFLWFGHARNLVASVMPAAWLLVVWVSAGHALADLVWRMRSVPASMTIALNSVTALLVLVNGAQIAAYGLIEPAIAAPQPSSRSSTAPAAATPDVWYLVFDRYGSASVLSEYYDFDNSSFLDALRERGFYVAEDANANYIKTPLSLVSSLEMEYLDAAELAAEAVSGDDDGPIHRRLRGPLEVPATLREHGYRYYHLANWLEPSSTNALADVSLRYEAASEFSLAVLRMTLASAFGEAEEPSAYERNVLREHTLFEFDALDAIADDPGPKYVFAHFLVPHPPYVFREDGSFVEQEPSGAAAERLGYVEQLTYTNRRILELVDRLLAVPESQRPVIVLQADEGPFPARYDADEWRFDWSAATDDELREKFGILNAYYLPGVEPEDAGLYPSITPVNTFRVIFNTYFGASRPLLDDRVYAHRSQFAWFDIFEVTERVRRD